MATQFSFSSGIDKILLSIGIVCAILHGTAFPIVMLIFGDLTDAFIDHAVTGTAVGNIDTILEETFNLSNISEPFAGNVTVDCDTVFNFNNVSLALDDIIPLIYGKGRVCLDDDAFVDFIEIQCYIYIGIAVGIFILSGLQSLFFQLVATRQIRLIRQNFYRAILRQNIGWFDANPSGELSSRLSE